MTAKSMRINKWIAASGTCSRRQADALILAGKVTINGRLAELGDQVGDTDRVLVDNQPIRPLPASEKVYLALNKPAGITCTTDRRRRDNIIDFLAFPERLFPVGRLDRDSEGLILLTNDGDIVNRILRAEHRHEKEYLVEVDRNLTADFLATMAQGVPILGTVTLPCRLHQVGPRRFRLVLTQGLNRQIRRMCEALGYQVTYLQRIRIMHITLGSLKTGQWRLLTAKELAELERLTTRRPPAARTKKDQANATE